MERARRALTVLFRSPTPRSSSLAAALAAAAGVLALGATASSGAPPSRAGTAAPPRAERLLDARAQLVPAASVHVPPGVAAARDHLARRLGPQAVVAVDPLTGAVQRLQRLDGALTGPSDQSPATVAEAYVRDHAEALGLDTAVASALARVSEDRSPSGLTVVRLRQSVDGVPTFDDAVQVAVDHVGRVLSLAGAPRPDLPADLPAPQLTAAQALARLMDETRAHRTATVVSAGHDPQRTTRFSTGDTAELVLFGARGVHLAWHVTFHATSTAWFDAVVDATNGAVLYRANLVKSAVNARVYTNYPGATNGGTQTIQDLTPYLSSSAATTLAGPYVHAFADINDDNNDNVGEDVSPGMPSNIVYTDTSSEGCDTGHICTWDHTVPTSWQANKDQNVTQTFWYANHFHDHLAAAPIGFTAAEGAFQADDPLELNALDGAATNITTGGPDADHLDNASMATPADGSSPVMSMYLFSHGADGGAFRDVNGGDDAAIVYHEYTHGLSGRLITTGAGTPAVSSAQASAMGEGWSDWYAEDFLVRDGLVPDTLGTDGDVDMGRYVDATPHGIRTEAMDCAVGSTDAAACPGAPGAGAGGYTYGDFARIIGGAEPHADGEIWGQTLWQLRSSLVADLGGAAGSDAAERLITDAMRLSPPEPSFLDMRNAILAADVNATGGANAARIWDVFRSRGMGFFAATTGGDDTAPVEDFSAPPSSDAPRGGIAGTVTNADTGLPVAGATASVAGLASGIAGAPNLAATTGGDGRYAIAAVPQGTYPKVAIASAGYDSVAARATVAGGQTTTLDAQLRRDWAAAPGGAHVASTTDDGGAPYGCGAAALIDQRGGLGWSAVNTTAGGTKPATVVELPAAITVTGFGLDPTNTCGDDAGASTQGYRIETSPDGQAWQTAAQGSFAAAARGHLNAIAPAGGTANVRFIRLTLLSPLDAASSWVDASELEVYGAPPNVPPVGSLVASPAQVQRGGTVTLDASSFRDPDTAITSYDWDIDGNGTVDRTTASPSIDVPYAADGTFAPAVTVRDFRGATGNAATSVTVVEPPPPPPAKTKAKPIISIPRTASRSRIRVRITCRDACRLSGTITTDRRSQRRARLRYRTVGRLKARTITGARTITLTLTASSRRALRRHHLRRLLAGVRLTAVVPAGGPRTAASRTVGLRL